MHVSTLDSALSYAKSGIYVFPVYVTRKADGKKDVRPVGPWRTISTISAADIAAWWAPGEAHEHAGLGIDCGKSGLVVIDGDGPVGLANLDALGLTSTGIAKTGGGGRHLFYREHPGHVIGNDQDGTVAPSVDVRGLGGCVFAAPTAGYEWLSEPDWAALPVVPEVVVRRMSAKAAPASSAPAAKDDFFDEPERTFTDTEAKAFVKEAIAELGKARGGFNGAINAFAMVCAHFPWLVDRERCARLAIKTLAPITGWTEPNHQDRATINSAYSATEAGRSWTAVRIEEAELIAGVVTPVEPADTSWTPRDITAVLDGTFTTPMPDLGYREDGEAMLYSGKEHSIASEPECGKTWWVLLQVRAVLAAGGNVVYVDFEDDEATIVGRLHHTLGVPGTLLGPDRFRYVRPDSKPSPEQYAALLDFSPALVVLDGVTESMSLLGLEVNSNDHSAIWRRTFVRPALAVGAATLSTDHVVKDREGRGRFALGGGHKLAGLTGAMFKLEQVQAFGKGLRGTSRVLVTKDRNGGLRGKGAASREPGISYMGDLVGDATGEPSWAFFAPAKEDKTPELTDGLMPPRRLEDAVVKVKRYLTGHPGATSNAIGANVEARRADILQALAWLESNGHAVMANGPRNAKTYALTGSRSDE